MNKSRNNIKFSKIFIVLAFFCFGLLVYRVGFLTTATIVDGRNIKEFATARSVYENTIFAKRGNIYDNNGDILAQNVSSYTLIAYLDPSRSEGESKLYHVKDKEKTATALATVIKLTKEEILEILNQDDLYQVEFGFAGKNLTEIEKEQIESLNLPGIDFIESQKRYYPNGDFASYAIGYAKKNEEETIEGELGLESLLDEQLRGTNGFTSYQVDVNGYKIPNTKEYTVPSEDGDNVYLTIDSNIQFFIEQAIEDAESKYDFEWMTIVVADAKTGAILGSTQRPSYDPNVLDIENYIDLTVSEPYEPGSIMKIYTYMAAMEAGTYDGNKTFTSGSYKVDEQTTINDWNRYGWGDITYDQGFQASSNVGVINIIDNFINKTILYDYFKRIGFGIKTGITLPNEQTGKIKFTYKSEIYNAGFGQGITTTPMQHIQALTAIANDGVMLQPYIISKVTDSKNNLIYEGKREELATVATHETVGKIKDLMYLTVNGDFPAATGTVYKLDGYDLIGKTGTAQLVNPNNGQYYTDEYNSTRSFVGIWPKDNPEVIIYASVKKSASGSYPLINSVQTTVQNVSKYLNIFKATGAEIIENTTAENYLNKEVKVIEPKLKEQKINYIIIGSGNKIIDQYPNKGYLLGQNDKLILITNGTDYKLPDLSNYSKTTVRAICNLLSLDCTYDGYGYAYSQSIPINTVIKEKDKLTVSFKEIYNTE